MDKEMELPAWKLRAIERGAIPDPRIKVSPEREPEKKKERKRADTPVERRVSLWVKPDVCTKLQHLAVYLGMPPSTSLGEVVEQLVDEKMKSFQQLEDMLARIQKGE